MNFSALVAEGVFTDLDSFSVDGSGSSMHLSLSQWADAILVAPATADFIAKMSAGVADCLACTTVLAFDNWDKVYIAPAMNTRMYSNPVTEKNINFLKSLGAKFIGPVSGKLADSSEGKGRMEEPLKIAEIVSFGISEEGPLSGKKILVTAGATREYIDPVRFITNASSGIMGIEIAKKAKLCGADVILALGHHTAHVPPFEQIRAADTTEELLEIVKSGFEDADILIMAAAPVDFKPALYSDGKLKKGKISSIPLTTAPDILKEVSKDKRNKIIVGFALQTEDVEENAIKKMKDKGMDIVVANSQGNLGNSVGSVIIIDKYGNKKAVLNKRKDEIAEEIINFLIEYISKEVKNG